MIQSRYQVLVGQVQQGVRDLQLLVDQTGKLMEKVERTGDLDYLGTVALNLHGFYAGAERIFQEVALQLDESLPEGRDWHQRLLRQMRTQIPGIRPAILQEETLRVLDELCRFRHVVQNVYAFDLKPERVMDLARMLPGGFAVLSSDLAEFCQFLTTVNEDN